MDCRDWERIVKNWDKFMDVHPKDVLDHLYQDGIWECKPTERKIENIYDLLEMLQKKPGTNTFGCFMRALKEGGHEELAAEIEATEVSADPSLKPRGDPSILEPKVRQALLCKFREMKDSKVSLSVIREELRHNFCRRGHGNSAPLPEDFVHGLVGHPPERSPTISQHSHKTCKTISSLSLIDDTQWWQTVSHEDPSDPSNYRPIALKSCLCKTL
ncbi:hypothetical protein PoB_002274200 [Plakobranchus ocellatus]|uniref:CARD domain-containing protein n=1 Tax=Plakobranchus ocellatus TaxID=259542 RepID=A0AAV3ZNL0_9GAST|nr:hypothetical protein PoB_002274200 [Plakobranchus ocellatus]